MMKYATIKILKFIFAGRILLNFKKLYRFSKVICFYNEFDRYKRAIGTCYLLINEKKKINILSFYQIILDMAKALIL